ncbi:MAG: uracil-DNA glycosylase [Myxococcales bacterium]
MTPPPERKMRLSLLSREIEGCRACPRLVAWRERVAREKRRAFLDWDYWGKPVPGFGDPAAWLVVVGLAPAAHGANRTGRMFTGDRSGDFLYAGLHRAGLANQETSRHAKDGLVLKGVYVTAPCRCAPPDNKPSPAELRRCAPFLDRELALLGSARVYLALGAIAWSAVLAHLERGGLALPKPAPRFGHGASLGLPEGRLLLGSYHVSQQNTQTGRLTPRMFDEVLAIALTLSRSGS